MTLHPVADTTLFQTYPDNNFGHYYLVAGTTARQGNRSRILMRFDPTNIPPGSVISSVQLTLTVNRSPHIPVISTFDLFRMLVGWSEGTGGAGQQTKGSPAKIGETTWNTRLSPDTGWSTPGASSPADYASTASASTKIASRLTFASTPQLVADVQAWLDQPDTNFGWILISESEELAGTARRFGARENASTAPALVVTYTAGTPPTPPTLTTQPQSLTVYTGETANFSVTADGSASLAYQWTLNVTNQLRSTNATLTLTNVGVADAGAYTVTVTNAAGSKTSAPATLTVQSAPLLTIAGVSAGVLHLSFDALAQHEYTAQFLKSFSTNAWQTLTNIPAASVATNVVVSDPISSAQQFYRLKAIRVP